jgi:hypothetical protein
MFQGIELACRVRLQTVPQFVDHLEAKVIAAIEREFSSSNDTANVIRFPVALHRIDPRGSRATLR